MRFFDGREEKLRSFGGRWLGTDDIENEYPTSGTKLKVTFSAMWIGSLILWAILLLFMLGPMSILIGGNVDFAFTCFLGTIFTTLVFFGIPILLGIGIVMLITGRNQVEKNTTRTTKEFVEVQFWKGQKKLPVQITRIPYENVKDVHPITDVEWNNDLRMGNPFRKIGLWPFRGPVSRFHQGAFRKDLCTFEFTDRMELLDYKEKQGTTGLMLTLFVSGLFANADRYVEEYLAYDNKIFVSMKPEYIQSLNQYIEERKKAASTYDPITGTSYDYMPQEQQVDDSWFLDMMGKDA